MEDSEKSFDAAHHKYKIRWTPIFYWHASYMFYVYFHVTNM
jgi:hypothetical protein